VRIQEVIEKTVPIDSEIRNAFIDFSEMTVSVVAIVTDVVRDGRAVIGYGFNSNGRYAPSGLLRDRFIPRLLRADPESIVTDDGDNLDPHRIRQVLMTGEKPGGHGERSTGVGVLDMAVWDAVAKIEGQPLYQLLADRYRRGTVDERVFVYAAGGYYMPGKTLRDLQDEMRHYRDLGYTVSAGKYVGSISAVSACMTAYNRFGISALRDALTVIQNTRGKDRNSTQGALVLGYAILLARAGASINRQRLAERIAKRFTPGRLLGAAKSYRDFKRVTLPESVAAVVQEEYNRNLRVGKIEESAAA
jgi:hypothetical protein